MTINISQALNVNNGSLQPGNFTSPGDVQVNVLGSSLTVNNASQVTALVRAVKATVTLNGTSVVRGQVIANALNMNGGKITGAVWPAMAGGCLTVFGARRFDRTTGQPNSYVEQFTLSASATGPYTLHLQNGADDKESRVSSARVKLNGADVLSPSDFNQNAGVIERNVTLAATNTLEVSLASKPGSFLTITITSACAPADTAPPVVSITSPADNFKTEDGTVPISGTAVDSGANASGVVSVTVNGAAAVFDAQAGTWAQAAALAVGANTITVRAVDNAGNAATQTITVTREITADAQPPALTVTSPLDQSSSYEASVTVTGTAVDEGANATGVRRIVVNGREAVYDAATREWAATDVPLNVGDNVISVVATDGAPTPNESRAQARVTRLRVSPPALVITSPQNGAFLSAESITVAGIVSSVKPDMRIGVTVNGQSATVPGGQFTSTVKLADGVNAIDVVATDALGQQARSSISVTSDRTPPVVSLTDVPSIVEAGKSYLITAQATDGFGVSRVDFFINGVRAASAAQAPYQFTFTTETSLAAGQAIAVTAVAHDLADAIGVASAQTVTTGPCGLYGHIFDDSTGYSLGNVMALPNNADAATSDEGGYFTFVSRVTTGFVRLSKDGYTPVDRLYIAAPGEGVRLFDARLTPLDAQANVIGVTGGNATGDGGRLQARFGANAFTKATDVRLTSVSPQGLMNLLPPGWSPVPGAVIDVRPASSTQAVVASRFASPAHLSVLQTSGLAAGTSLVLARYDEQAHRWIAASRSITAGPNGALEADLPGPGQYAFLVADTGNTAPPSAIAGEALMAGPGADAAALNLATAVSAAEPAASLYSQSAKAAVSFVATPQTRLPSGISIKATFGETYNLLFEGEPLSVDRPAQDIVLYSYPAASIQEPNRIGAFFVAKPTRAQLNVADIFNANVHVEISPVKPGRAGMLVDQSGAAMRAGNGAQLFIPATALSSMQPVFFDSAPVEPAGVQIPGAEIVAAFDIDLTGKTLSRSAIVSLPP
ncbi:MAG TPA: Ig-like domain-containing protein, partial [Blastocatellia bacterium]